MEIISIVLFLILIPYSQSQEITTLFNCTFDIGFVDDCIFTSIFSSGEPLDISTGEEFNANDINRPLSDATSVFSPTINGEMCQFPYDLDGLDMYFCLYQENTADYICPTESGNQTCVQGQYGYKTFASHNRQIVAYKSSTIIRINSTDEEHCLRFYYYFTNNFRDSSMSFRIHYNTNTTIGETIAFVKPNNENKWYYSETSFTPSADEYYLVFLLYQNDESNDTTNFTYALDNISIINRSCFYTGITSTTTVSSTITTTSTVYSNRTIPSSTTSDNLETTTTTQSTNTIITSSTTASTLTLFNSTTTSFNNSTTTSFNNSTTTSFFDSTSTSFFNSTTTSFNNSTTTSFFDSTSTSFFNSTSISKSKNNFAVILGLSLGLGVPAIFIVIAIVIYFIKSKL